MPSGPLSPGFLLAVLGGAAIQAGVLTTVVVLAGGRDALADPLLLAAIALLTAWVAAESIALGERTRPGGGEGQRGLARAAALLIFAIVVIALAERAAFARDGAPAAAVLLALGVGLRVVAVRTLGRWFLDEPRVVPGQPHIRTGIYRHMHHPSEVGNLLICLGLAWMLGSVGAVAATVVALCPLTLIRVRIEDRVLREHFGEE
jgi:protein-S-isoprenylcysteine O-methyltransferase Ste14